jgi:hypothetical protein
VGLLKKAWAIAEPFGKENAMRRTLGVLCLGAGVLALAGLVYAGGDGVVTLDGLKSKVPASWKQEKVPAKSGKLRIAQFRLPKAKDELDDAELAIFFFGTGSGGSTADNIKRWKEMFDAPKGKTIDESTKVEQLKVGKVPVTVVDVQGTYKEKFPPFAPNAKITRKENYRLIGVVFESENGPYFLRVTGPAATVEHHKKDFDSWLKNFK